MPNNTPYPRRLRIFRRVTLIPPAIAALGMAVGVAPLEDFVTMCSLPLGAYGLSALLRPYMPQA